MNKNKKIILIIVFLSLMLLSIINIIDWNNENKRNDDIISKEKKHIKKNNNTKYLDKKIKKENLYTIGWLIVEGTNINYPVVKYKDNSYYLNHDYYNDYNSAGWIFMDYRNKLDDQNIVIYGHHRRDGSMFGSIDNLLSNKNINNKILFITEEGTTTYKIFSVYNINKEDNYNDNNFKDFNKMINIFKNRSEINFHENIDNIKQLITLSTCHSNNKDRIVVHGYKKN